MSVLFHAPLNFPFWWSPSQIESALGHLHSYGWWGGSPPGIRRYRKALTCFYLLLCSTAFSTRTTSVQTVGGWDTERRVESAPKPQLKTPDTWQTRTKIFKITQSNHSLEQLHEGAKLSPTQRETADQTIYRLGSKYTHLLLHGTKTLWLSATHHYNGNRWAAITRMTLY